MNEDRASGAGGPGDATLSGGPGTTSAEAQASSKRNVTPAPTPGGDGNPVTAALSEQQRMEASVVALQRMIAGGGQTNDHPAPRRRGRPPIGKPNTVRLPESETAFVTKLGGNSLPDGVRLTVRHLMLLGRPLDLDDGTIAALLAMRRDTLAAAIEAMLDQQTSSKAGEEVRKRIANLRVPKALTPSEAIAQNIPPEMLRIAQRLGDGDAARGVAKALRVAKVMGVDVVNRLDDGPDQ
jgi:hypothetical protein